jgi:hypothetical protein
VVLPPDIAQRPFHEVLTGRAVAVEQRDGQAVIPLAQVFSHCPVALLASSVSADV